MGAWDVVWSLYLSHLGASKTYISMTWVAFSVPMLLSFVGGMFADRYSRFWLFVVGYALSSLAWMFYGVSTNLVALIVVNVLEGFAIAFSYPAKQAFLIQVSPKRWLGTVTGVEATSMQLAGLLGSLTAPLMYARISGRVLTFAGIVAIVGLLGGRARPVQDVEPAQGDRRHAVAGRAGAARRRLADRVRGRAAARAGVRPGDALRGGSAG